LSTPQALVKRPVCTRYNRAYPVLVCKSEER
jgi:hypothetical protein